MHSQKTLKVEINVQNTDAQMLLILLFKNMLILTGKNLSSIYTDWLFGPKDTFFNNFSLILHFFQDFPEKV